MQTAHCRPVENKDSTSQTGYKMQTVDCSLGTKCRDNQHFFNFYLHNLCYVYCQLHSFGVFLPNVLKCTSQTKC